MSLAPSALIQLDSACEIFSKAAHGFRAEKVLVGRLPFLNMGFHSFAYQSVMVRLQKRAHLSLAKFRSEKSNAPERQSPKSEFSSAHSDDELSTLGGKTRLVSKKEEPPPMLQERTPGQTASRVPFPLTSNEPSIHPNVVEYLRTFTSNPTEAAVAPNMRPSSDAAMLYAPSLPGSQYSSLSLFQRTLERRQHHEASFQPPSSHDQSPLTAITSEAIPQYFPVYDYGTGCTEAQDDIFSSMHMEMPIVCRLGSSASEESMHTTWQDFVTGLGMT
jgi:hypothetical protein